MTVSKMKKLDENDLQKCLYFANGQNITTATAKNVLMYINTEEFLLIWLKCF